MNSYHQKQQKVISQIENEDKSGKSPSTIVKPVKDYINDNRICFTSVVFLPIQLEQKIIDKIIILLSKADRHQYFYTPGSFHLTIQNIRTISDPPLFNNNDIEKTKEVFAKIIPKYNRFTFKLKGLFELPTSLAVCGYTDETFTTLSSELTHKLIKAGVPDNKKYFTQDIIFGNLTFCRYTQKPNAQFMKIVSELKNVEIGDFEVKSISLITTNAAATPNKTQIIQDYPLK